MNFSIFADAGTLTLIGVASVLSSAITWVVGMILHKKEIEKLQAEIVNLKGEHVERLQKARGAYNAATSACTKSCECLRNLIAAQADTLAVDEARLQFCSTFIEVAIPAYLDYCEVWQLGLLGNDGRLKDMIDKHVIPELERFAEWLQTINDPNILRHLIGRSPAVVSQRNLEFFRDLAVHVPSSDQRVYFARLDKAINLIIAANGELERGAA